MKRCPTCEKTFDDNLRFCQADGTPLVDAEEELDPYKTMVAKPGEIAAALAANKGADEGSKEDSVLELPDEPDPNKTQFVSEKELRDEMAAADNQEVMDLPPEPPKFNEPEPPSPPKMGGPPPSPFGQPKGGGSDQFSQTSPPIPSPFGGPSEPKREEPPAPKFEEPEPPKPQFAEPEPAEPKFDPFEAQAPTAPPPARMQQDAPQAPMGGPVGQMGGAAAPPPANAAGGQNKTLALVSLIAGILSLCCWISPLTGLIAIVTGFLGMKKANNDPANYGGKGLAIAGLVLGGLLFVAGIAYWIFILFFNGLAMLQNMQ